MNITILDGFACNPGDLNWDDFEKMGTLAVYDTTPKEDVIKRIADSEIVYTNKTPLDAEAVASAKKLKFIGVLATGYNVVDVKAAAARGIPVCNIPTYGTQAVAQAAIALLLEITNRGGLHSDAVKAGEWIDPAPWTFTKAPLMELYGKRMGVIGYGRIGKATAGIARALGMDVVAFDSNGNGEELVALETLYATSDVIALHCPQTPETEKMINAASIAKMKDGVILINNSRGGLIDESALANALNTGKVYAAGLDVLSVEQSELIAVERSAPSAELL
jgi:glycerate dehydrogenase